MSEGSACVAFGVGDLRWDPVAVCSMTSAMPATSFGSVAEDYDRGRPAYPAEMVEWALGPGPLEVLDVGAGTGKLTTVLAEAGHRVTAADPLPEMTSVLERRLSGVRTVTAKAEQLPLPAGRYCAVAVGQAFHWFDHERALSEMARVTRPGAVLALFWNVYAGDDDWVQYPRAVSESWLAALDSHPRWLEFEHRAQAWDFDVTLQSLLAFACSHSSVAALSARKRRAYVKRIAQRAAATADTGTLPFVTHAWRGRRAG